MIRIQIFIGLFLLGLFSLSANAAPNAVVSVTRTSCVAPCGVVFDASGTTSTATSRPFHEIGYSWNFGDSSAGSWTKSNGRSQNTAVGAIAAHVYQTAGTFTVTLAARDSAGTATNSSTVITVTAADTAWSGTKTQCVSTTGNFTGCPAGANQVTTSNLDTAIAWVNGGPGRRLLFRAGESWSTSSGYSLRSTGPSMISSYGGGQAIISGTASAGPWASIFDLPAADWRVVNLKLVGPNVAGRISGVDLSLNPVDSGNFRLVFGNEIVGTDAGIAGGWNHVDDAVPSPSTIIGDVVADNYIHDLTGYGLYAGGLRNGYIGNRIEKTGSHVFRSVYSYKSTISDNSLKTPLNSTQTALKLHAKSYGTGQTTAGPDSRYVEIANNDFQGGVWTVALAPQNAQFNEVVHDIVLEQNRFFADASNTNVSVQIGGYDFTLRNNAFDGSSNVGNTYGGAISGDPGSGPGVYNVGIYNNTFVTTLANAGWFAGPSLNFPNVQVRNNIAYNLTTINGGSLSFAYSLPAANKSNNLVYYPNFPSKCENGTGGTTCVNPSFVSTDPASANYLKLNAGSPAIDKGISGQPVYDDYYGAPRAAGAGPDLGISEFASTVAATPTPVAAPTVDFSASPTSGVGSLTTTFTPAASGAITSWKWDFGDGTSNSGTTTSVPSAVKFYGAAGSFTVTLTATGPGGTVTKSKAGLISVTAAPTPTPTPTPTPVTSGATGGTTSGAVATPTPTPTPSGSGLVAALGFDETSGTGVTDASGRGNNGTITSATRTAAGKFGGALQFNGASSYVTIPDSASLDLTGGMTLEAWVYPQTTVGGGRTVIMKEDVGGADYSLYAAEDVNVPDLTVFNGAYKTVAGPSPLALNQWTHLAATYDGTTQRLYVNGVAVASRAQTGAIQTSAGALKIGGNAVWGEWFLGSLDEIRVYNRALSAAEISADMAVPVSMPAIVVDDLDANTQRTGTWTVSGAPNRWGSDALSTNDATGRFRWNPDIKLAGKYQVYAWWSNYAPDTSWRSANVPYTIVGAGVSNSVIANQQISGGQWNLLGTYSFDPAKTNYVEVSAALGWACADAVKLVRVGP